MIEKVIKIEKIVFGGKGLSRDLEKVIFVPLTLPGEKVRVRITKEHADYLEGEVIEILEPDTERVAPECSYFGICGGCQLSHATYEKQLQIKLQVLQETLHRNAVKFPEIEVIGSKPFGYRHRAQLKYDPVHRSLGFYERESNRVVDIQECICLTPALNEVLKSVRSRVRSGTFPNLREVECYENESRQTAVFSHPTIPELTPSRTGELTISFREYKFPINPRIFLQVNPGMWRALIQEVESHYEKSQGQTALELYCGAGFFTAPLARRFRRVIACEENLDAIRYAREHHGLLNVEWNCTRAENFKFPNDAQVVIVDPPRAGLHRNVLTQLIELNPEWISYISCDCTTFARDVKKLNQLYAIEKLTMLDLFPQTYHFESVALLRRV